MEGLIGGVLIGATAALLGPPVLSGLSKGVSPAGQEFANIAKAAWDTIAGWISTLGTVEVGPAKSDTKSSRGSVPTQEGVIQKIEEVGKEMAIELAEEEAMAFIKMVLVAAL